MSTKSDMRRLEREWLVPRIQPGVGYDSGVENGILRLACAYGASRVPDDHDLDIFIHDMAHLVEIPLRRVLVDNFGMKPNANPRTTQATERECRTIAIQLRIHEALGSGARRVAEVRRSWEVALVRDADDADLIPGDKDAWVHMQVGAALPRWPLSRVRAEWWRKAWYVERTLRATSRRSVR